MKDMGADMVMVVVMYIITELVGIRLVQLLRSRLLCRLNAGIYRLRDLIGVVNNEVPF